MSGVILSIILTNPNPNPCQFSESTEKKNSGFQFQPSVDGAGKPRGMGVINNGQTQVYILEA